MTNKKHNFDYSVSFIRVSAMFFIVFCHLSSHYGITALAQFFNVGVPIFFMISGYLYGNKKVEEPIGWLYKRYIRLIIPAFMWLILWSIVNFKIPDQQNTLMVFMNLQGLNFMFTRIQDLGNGPWFLSIIMICYIVLLCYLKVEEKHRKIGRIFNYGGIFPLVVYIALALIGVRTEGLLAFFIGFNLKRKDLPKTNKMINLLVALAAFVVAVGLRLLSKKLFDETIIHTDIIAPISHVVLAASIIVGVKWLFDVMPRVMNYISKNAVFKYLDKISIYVYVTHRLMFFVLAWKLPLYLLLPIYFVIAILTATLFWLIGDYVTKRIDKLVFYCFKVK